MRPSRRRHLVVCSVAMALMALGCTSRGPSVETSGSTGPVTSAIDGTTTSTTTRAPIDVDAEVLQPWVDGICAAVGPWGRWATAMGPDDVVGTVGERLTRMPAAARDYAAIVSATADAIGAGPATADGELVDVAAEATATLRRSAAEWESIAEAFDAMAADPTTEGWDELFARHHEAEQAATAAFGELMSYPVRAGADTGGCGVLLSVIDGSLQAWMGDVCAAAAPLWTGPSPQGVDQWAAWVRQKGAAVALATADAIEAGIGVATDEFRREAESAVAALRRSATEWEAIAREMEGMGEDLTSEEQERLDYLLESGIYGVLRSATEPLGPFLDFPYMAGIDLNSCGLYAGAAIEAPATYGPWVPESS